MIPFYLWRHWNSNLFSIEIGETYRTHIQTLFILKIFMQQLPEDYSKLKRDHLYSNNFFLPLYIFSVLTHQRTNPTAQSVFWEGCLCLHWIILRFSIPFFSSYFMWEREERLYTERPAPCPKLKKAVKLFLGPPGYRAGLNGKKRVSYQNYFFPKNFWHPVVIHPHCRFVTALILYLCGYCRRLAFHKQCKHWDFSTGNL